MIEPELIEIIEGPTPDFQPAAQHWLQSLHETPSVHEVAMCQLRTVTGSDIKARCADAWSEGRPVRLDFPDEMRLRQQLDVVALRLSEVGEGQMLTLWVSVPYSIDFDDLEDGDEEFEEDDEEDEEDEDDDALYLS